jgi:prevent-host-death family protein
VRSPRSLNAMPGNAQGVIDSAEARAAESWALSVETDCSVLRCSTMLRIGVRELRQHASRYLALVARGEPVEVTDRGRPVALLVPVRGEPWDALLASNRVSQPEDAADLADEDPEDYGFNASNALRSIRDLER